MTFRQLERVARGFSNHRRIQMLTLLSATPALDVLTLGRLAGWTFGPPPNTPTSWSGRALSGSGQKVAGYCTACHREAPKSSDFCVHSPEPAPAQYGANCRSMFRCSAERWNKVAKTVLAGAG